MNAKNRTTIILILGFLSAIAPFSIDMYLPGFPAIAIDLHTSIEMVSYSLSSFFIGVCIGQVLCGPLLDRFGRKMPLYAGLLLYIAATIGCVFTKSVEVLIALRFLQAIGGCVGMVAPRAIIRDLFHVDESAKIFSYMILILGVSPIIAPTAGSYIITHFGWHAIFILLTIISVLLFAAVVIWLPESRQPDPSFSLKPKPILDSFWIVLKQPQFFTYAVTGAISSAGLFAYLAGSPYVFMKLFGTTEQQYGGIFALIATGLITSSQLNNLCLKKFNSQQIVKATLTIQTIAGLLLFAGTAAGWLNLYTTIALIFLYLSCQGFNFPNASALSMAPFSKHAGSASALMGAIQMGFGALSSAVVGLFNPHSAMPMTGVMAACVLLSWIILFFREKKITVNASAEDVEVQTLDMIEKY
ncbi:multidrug effflux MFS transporter [Ferruginibacter sp.]|uniref:multidrug effflux MFS transporter n=1 Tax=Ferruginibacter sp. TaxID=1940288 RepID=UPI0019855C0C|nr:multidrug effflux MFS transporter [Ferruginibacter sp.]MBC7627851.1 multidrug effflux MFS transporter [Ferruginibacter sp.]